MKDMKCRPFQHTHATNRHATRGQKEGVHAKNKLSIRYHPDPPKEPSTGGKAQKGEKTPFHATNATCASPFAH